MPKKTKDKPIEVPAEHLHLISKVRTFDGDISAFKSRIKTIQERMAEIIEGTDEGSKVLKLQEELEAARTDLKRRLQGNSEYIKLTEDLADERLSLHDAEDNMSDFLLGYFADTRERQIELGPGQGREVVVKAKLGKEKDYQTNLFSAPAQEDKS